MADYPAIITEWLGRMYGEVVLNRTPLGVASSRFRDALEADENLKQAAQNRLNSLTDAVTNKCHISRMHRDFLRSALQR